MVGFTASECEDEFSPINARKQAGGEEGFSKGDQNGDPVLHVIGSRVKQTGMGRVPCLIWIESEKKYPGQKIPVFPLFPLLCPLSFCSFYSNAVNMRFGISRYPGQSSLAVPGR